MPRQAWRSRGHPWQFHDAKSAFEFLELLAAGGSGNYILGPVVWVGGRPKNVDGVLIVQEFKQELLQQAINIESSKINRPLTAFEQYQVACDLDNR